MRGWIVSAVLLLLFTVRGMSELSELLARVVGDKLVVHIPAFTRNIVVWRE